MSKSIDLYISVNKNRMKIYNNSIYMKNGTEFQLEFKNNSPHLQKAVISINGIVQENALILKANQHFYLERFLDSNAKFVFDTYSVDNNKKVKRIIKNNGLIKVLLYKEYQFPYYTTTYTSGTYNINGPLIYTTSQFNCYDINTTSVSNVSYNDILAHSNITTKSSEILTGRVKEGEESSQMFVQAHNTFEAVPHTIIEYKIIPIENKPKEIFSNQIRDYCSKCGRRIKENWQYCPGCGAQR